MAIGSFEYGISVSNGVGQGSMEFGIIIAAGMLGQERRLWVKVGGAWVQVVRAYQKVAGSWTPVTIRQKVAGIWIPVLT